MKFISRNTLCLAVLSLTASLSHAQTTELRDGWQCQSSTQVSVSAAQLSAGVATASSWYSTKVPTTVMGALVANGEYPDILVSDHYRKHDNSRFLVPWIFKNDFSLQGLKSSEHVRLLFEGVGYSANIYLNGRLIASRDTVKGPFRTFALDVTGIAREHNTLVVETYKCQPGDFNIGYVDWNPRPLDESMGLVRPVKVQRSGAVVIDAPRVCSRVNLQTLHEAWVNVETQVRNLSNQQVSGRLVCRFEGSTASVPVILAPRQARTLRLDHEVLSALHVVNPRLWWCYTMGSPELYNLSLAFETGSQTSDTQQLRFGIRQVDSYITNEGFRAFTLNGQRIQLLGAGWTDDIFLRDDTASYNRQLELVRQMHLNTVRLEGFWGTSQALYDLCDEKGILLLAGWSCFWEWDSYLGKPCDELYGGILTADDARLIARSYDDQLRYLRNHPSIIAWFVGSDKLPIPALEYHYKQAQTTIDDRPYIISAKQLESAFSGTSGTKMAGPYEYVAPAYWYSAEAPGGAFGFNTETGIGAQLPVKESLVQMFGSKLWPLNEVWDYHCTTAAEAFNKLDVLKQTVASRYGEATNIDDFLRKANMVNYDGTRAMFEAFRYNSPRATGLIQWMLNAARPSLYWQLYDHYLRPNAAFYSVKKACAPVQLVYNYLTHQVKAVNATRQSVKLQASYKLYGLGGRVLSEQSANVEVPALGSVAAFDAISLTEPHGFLFLTASANGQPVADNAYALSAQADVFDWAKTDWTHTPLLKSVDLSPVAALQPVKCKVQVHPESGRAVRLAISNPTKQVAYMLRIVLKDCKGRIIDGVDFSDNYITIAPGAIKTVHCQLPADVKFKVELLPY